MLVHEHGYYLWELATFYIVVWLFAIGCCIAVRDEDAFIKGVFLGILFFANQYDEFWLDSGNMMVFHFAAILLMLPAMLNVKHWKSFLVLTYVMFLSDAAWLSMTKMDIEPNYYAFPYNKFYWQSILNISNCILVFITIKGCYDTHESERLEKRKRELEADADNTSAGEKSDSIGIQAVA